MAENPYRENKGVQNEARTRDYSKNMKQESATFSLDRGGDAQTQHPTLENKLSATLRKKTWSSPLLNFSYDGPL